MNDIFGFEYKNGQVVKRTITTDPGKQRLLDTQSVQFLTTLINNIITKNFPGKYSSFSHFTNADLEMVVATINRAKARKLMANATTFTVTDNPHSYSNEIVKTETEGGSVRAKRMRYGMSITEKQPLPPVNAELARFITGSVRISRSAAGNATRAIPVEAPAKTCASFVPDLSKVGQAAIATFGDSLSSISDAEDVVTKALDKSPDFSKAFCTIRDKVVPSNISVVSSKGRQTKIRNAEFRIPEKYKGANARSMIKNLMQVPMTDKSGMGYYAQSHYDGLNVTGVERKYAEIVQDFDFTADYPVIRVTSADRKVALALYNAATFVQKKVVVVYEGNETNRLQRYWDGKKVIRTGVVPYPGKLFDHVFRDKLSKVYYYSLDNPTISVNHAVDALYNSNQRVKELQTYYAKYGKFTFYVDWSSLISFDEYKTYKSVNEAALQPLTSSFSPTCKVRKGWVMASSDGPMDVDQAMNNIANGRLHYLTWMYRANHFCADGDLGHKHVTNHAPKYDWVTGDSQVKLDPLIFSQLEGVVDNATLTAFKKLVDGTPPSIGTTQDDEEERPEQDDDEPDMFCGLAESQTI